MSNTNRISLAALAIMEAFKRVSGDAELSADVARELAKAALDIDDQYDDSPNAVFITPPDKRSVQ